MIVLGLDTTGAACSAGLVRDGEVLALISELIGRGHAERLAPMVQSLMAQASLSPDQIDRIAVCTGPGSFTGLRVALSYAKGFALPRQRPVIGLNAMAIAALTPGTPPDIAKTIYRDVKRGQVMFAHYRGDEPRAFAGPQLGTLDEMQAAAADLGATLIEATHVDVARMAQWAATLDPDAYPADPLYARAPDAKRPGGLSLSA